MPGNRRTHNYPEGKPFPLVLLDIMMAVLVGLWVFLVPGHWPRAIGMIALFLLFALARAKLTGHYERTGKAVPIPRRRVLFQFSGALPLPVRAMHLAFFVIVAIIAVFGFASIDDSTAKAGIIACVFALVAVAVLKVGLVGHYVSTGRAKEIDIQPQ
jgi:hypothetical protein